jgi:hypothetical protein
MTNVNVCIKSKFFPVDLYFYQHGDANNAPEKIRKALAFIKEGNDRDRFWKNDEGALARIIFCAMVKDTFKKESYEDDYLFYCKQLYGFYIGFEPVNDDTDRLDININDQTILLKEELYTFEEFIKQDFTNYNEF